MQLWVEKRRLGYCRLAQASGLTRRPVRQVERVERTGHTTPAQARLACLLSLHYHSSRPLSRYQRQHQHGLVAHQETETQRLIPRPSIPPPNMRVALLLAATLPLLTLADSPSSSSRRETALTGPYSGPSPSLEEDTGASDLLWSDIPAVQLGRGLQPPHRWKEFLPRHPASEEDSVKAVLGRSAEERRKLREVDDGPRATRKVNDRRREGVREHDEDHDEEEEEEEEDNDDDDDDDDEHEQQESLTSARARKRQKNEQDRQAMNHLKSRAKKEAKVSLCRLPPT